MAYRVWDPTVKVQEHEGKPVNPPNPKTLTLIRKSPDKLENLKLKPLQPKNIKQKLNPQIVGL